MKKVSIFLSMCLLALNANCATTNSLDDYDKLYKEYMSISKMDIKYCILKEMDYGDKRVYKNKS